MAKRQLEKGKKLLRKIDFFKPFSDDEVEELLDISLVKKYDLNDVIIREDKEGYTFYVILSGAAKIVKEISPDKEVELAIFSEGDCFGEMAILLEERRTATVLAGVNCYVFEIEGNHIETLSQSIQIKLYRQFAITLAERLKISAMKS